MELTMNHDQIESAIEHAINALALAKLALSKSALPVFNDGDILRKADLAEPKADPAARALEMLDALTRQVDALKAADAARANADATRKTYRAQS
jgi:hypothetical protein